MSFGRLLLRSLLHHRGVNIAVALGVAVGAAVLAGALIVGDSVRGSLRDLTLERLGAIDHALVSDRYVSETLAEETETAPAILVRGSADAPASGARASSVNIHGVDQRFWELFSAPKSSLGSRQVLLNQTLASELGASAGEAVLLRFRTDTLVPSESVMGRKSGNIRTLRLTVADVLPDRGVGRFGLQPSQQLPLNAFLPLATLQRALDQNRRANALFATGEAPALDEKIELDDLQLRIETVGDALSVETNRIVLEQQAAEAAFSAAEKTALEAVPVLTYLANSITIGERTIPYSTVTAIEPSPGPFDLEGDEILLNAWAADDLSARPGDAVELTYYVVGPRGGLETASHAFQLAGVLPMEGLAVDRDLAPTYPGLSDVDRMGDWDPPFPVDLNRIRTADEAYWEEYRTAPKAFVALETAKRLWTSRFGQLTSIRLRPIGRQPLEQVRDGVQMAFQAELRPEAFGLAFQPVKRQGLEAASGSTDFAGLFIGFSLFLIASAALLVTLLFRLGVERRAREAGLLFATGQSGSFVRRLFLTEGAILALAGCLIGLPGGVGYAALMVHGLSTWWSAAVGGSFLTLHVGWTSLLLGALGAFVLMFGAIWLAVRQLEKRSVRGMLAGALADEADVGRLAHRAGLVRRIAAGCLVLALALSAAAFAVDAATRAGLFFGVGALLLIAALAYFRSSLLSPPRSTLAAQTQAPLWRLGVRNGSRFPTRSVLSAALVASASFVIVTVALMRHDVRHQEPRFDSGDGGFRLTAQSDLPIYQDQLGESEVPMLPLRRRLGEDASCLNLYQPSDPTLLGAPDELIERGGFAFQSSLAETDAERANPWLVLRREFADGAVPVFGDANSVMWILHLGLGDRLEIEDANGVRRKLVIAGLLARSIFQSELILAEDRFLELFPEQSGFEFFLIDAPESAGARLEERWAERGFDAMTAADRLAGFLVVENTYLSTFQTLGGLGLLLGALGLAVVMVRNVLERRRELAVLQAVGFGESSISKLVVAENGFLLVFGLVIGTAAALLATLPTLLSGQAEPQWGGLSLTLLAVLLTGLLAGAAAVRVSLRQPLLPSLRRE